MLEASVDYNSPSDGRGVGGINNGNDDEESEEEDIRKLEAEIARLDNIANGLEGQLDVMADSNIQQQNQQQQVGKDADKEGEPVQREADQQQQTDQPESEEKKNGLTGLNILLLYADDWTHSTLSSYHKTQPLNTILKTPILDALAADGVRFTHNCVTTSVCWISRATLYTGQYMSRHKTKEPCCWNGGTKPKQKLPEAPSNWKELSFYEILAKHKYHVGHAGKWGVYLPFEKNVHFNVEEDGWHYRKLGKKMWHITEKNEADALRFLVTRPKDKPFFLNVAFYATHAKDGDVRQYMPQNSSMGMYAEDTIPRPPTGTQEAWEKMPYFFGEKNEGRTRWHWRYDNDTKHQTMMKNYYRMGKFLINDDDDDDRRDDLCIPIFVLLSCLMI